MPDNGIPPTAPGFRTVAHGKGKAATYEVFCAACGERLVVGGGTDTGPGLALAEVNARPRPCCAAWADLEWPEPDGWVGEQGTLWP